MTTLTSIHPLPYRLKIHLSADSAKSSLAYPNMSATMLPLTGWCWARIVLQAITPGGALGANRFHKCSLTCATNSQNMAEPAGSDESPWAKGEATFKRCVTHTLACSRKSLVFYCLSACLDLKTSQYPRAHDSSVRRTANTLTHVRKQRLAASNACTAMQEIGNSAPTISSESA